MASLYDSRRYDDYGYTRSATVLDSDEHNDILCRVREDIRESAAGKRSYEELGRRAYRAYRAYLDPSKHAENFDVEVLIPYFFTTLETKLSRIMQRLFGGGSFLSYRPRGATRAKQAELLSSLFDLHWMNRRPMAEVRDLLKSMMIFGTAYASTSWREEWRWVTEWQDIMQEMTFEVDPVTGEQMTVPVTTQQQQVLLRKVTDGPWFDQVCFPNAFPDWKRPTAQEGRYWARRLWVDREYVKDQLRSRRWKRRITKQILESEQPFSVDSEYDAGEVTKESYRWMEEVGFGLADHSQDDIATGRLFEVIEHWSPAGVAVVVNRSYVVAADDNPFRHGKYPVIQVKNKSLPGEHFGMSDFEVVEKLYTHMQEMANANGQEALLSAYPVTLVREGVQNISKMRHKPGAIWRFNGDGDIIPYVRPTSGMDASASSMSQMKLAIDDTLGTSEAFRGMVNPRATATATTQAMSSASGRLEDDIANFEEQFTLELGDQWRSLIQQFQSYDVQVRLSGDPQAEPVNVKPGDIHDADCDTMVGAGSSSIRELELKRVLEYWQTCLQFQVPAVDPYGAAEVVAELMLPKYKDRIMRPREDAMALIQQQMMIDQTAKQSESMDKTTAAPGGAVPVDSRTADKQDDGGTMELSREQGNEQTY